MKQTQTRTRTITLLASVILHLSTLQMVSSLPLSSVAINGNPSITQLRHPFSICYSCLRPEQNLAGSRSEYITKNSWVTLNMNTRDKSARNKGFSRGPSGSSCSHNNETSNDDIPQHGELHPKGPSLRSIMFAGSSARPRLCRVSSRAISDIKVPAFCDRAPELCIGGTLLLGFLLSFAVVALLVVGCIRMVCPKRKEEQKQPRASIKNISSPLLSENSRSDFLRKQSQTPSIDPGSLAHDECSMGHKRCSIVRPTEGKDEVPRVTQPSESLNIQTIKRPKGQALVQQCDSWLNHQSATASTFVKNVKNNGRNVPSLAGLLKNQPYVYKASAFSPPVPTATH